MIIFNFLCNYLIGKSNNMKITISFFLTHHIYDSIPYFAFAEPWLDAHLIKTNTEHIFLCLDMSALKFGAYETGHCLSTCSWA